MTVSAANRAVGIWATGSTLALSLAYIAAQLVEWVGLLGSAGGPNAASTPLGIALLLTPSLLLGPAFAVIYATLTGLVYFVQLTFVGPRLATGDTQGIELLLFVPYKSFLFAVDLLGYSLMSAATLIAAFGLPDAPGARATRRAMIANGAILPFLAFQMFIPALIWGGAAWGVTFPLAMALLLRQWRGLPTST